MRQAWKKDCEFRVYYFGIAATNEGEGDLGASDTFCSE